MTKVNFGRFQLSLDRSSTFLEVGSSSATCHPGDQQPVPKGPGSTKDPLRCSIECFLKAHKTHVDWMGEQNSVSLSFITQPWFKVLHNFVPDLSALFLVSLSCLFFVPAGFYWTAGFILRSNYAQMDSSLLTGWLAVRILFTISVLKGIGGSTNYWISFKSAFEKQNHF